jgi:hypothetical protein
LQKNTHELPPSAVFPKCSRSALKLDGFILWARTASGQKPRRSRAPVTKTLAK